MEIKTWESLLREYQLPPLDTAIFSQDLVKALTSVRSDPSQKTAGIFLGILNSNGDLMTTPISVNYALQNSGGIIIRTDRIYDGTQYHPVNLATITPSEEEGFTLRINAFSDLGVNPQFLDDLARKYSK